MKTKKKRASGIKIGDTYDFYKSFAPKDKLVGRKEYYKYVKTFLNYMSDKLINIGMVKIPSSLGVLQIMGSNTKIYIDKKTGKMKGNVDWHNTLKLWDECPECKENKQLVYFTNDETGFKIYKFYWINKINRIENKSIYRFRSCKPIRIRLAKKIRTGDFSYLYYQGDRK